MGHAWVEAGWVQVWVMLGDTECITQYRMYAKCNG